MSVQERWNLGWHIEVGLVEAHKAALSDRASYILIAVLGWSIVVFHSQNPQVLVPVQSLHSGRIGTLGSLAIPYWNWLVRQCSIVGNVDGLQFDSQCSDVCISLVFVNEDACWHSCCTSDSVGTHFC